MRTGSIFLMFLSMLLSSCGAGKIVDGVRKDESLGDFLVTSGGDTLRGSDLRIKYAGEAEPLFFYKGQRLHESHYFAYQTEGGYSTRTLQLSDSCCLKVNYGRIFSEPSAYHLIRKGKINVYYTIRSAGQAGRIVNDYATLYEFYFQKGNGLTFSFTNRNALRDKIKDNPEALAQFEKSQVALKEYTKKTSGKINLEILKIIETYNKG